MFINTFLHRCANERAVFIEAHSPKNTLCRIFHRGVVPADAVRVSSFL